ncbi:MAG TPA: SgcJ/EcaC family oxidoreductase [Steroidobacter sp.]
MDWERRTDADMASLMTEDADFVNVGARRWKGRAEIEAEHTQRLNQFRESTWSTEAVTVQFLKPDVVLVHVNWALKGDKDPDGTPRSPRSSVFTWVVVNQSNGWLIRAAQNTNRGNLGTQPATSK